MSLENEIKESDKERAPLEKPLEKIVRPLRNFVKSQVASGVLLLCATVVAIIVANSPWSDLYHSLNHFEFSISLDQWSLSHSLKHWVNDGLLVLFFFLLGMEIKRELLVGDLKDFSQSSFVLVIALGGMVAPALIYFIITSVENSEFTRGWGIPMATDTAFALGLLSLLGKRVPPIATVLLSALAIVDDIGAVLVINLFYSEGIALAPIVNSGLMIVMLVVMNMAGVRTPLPYFIVGILLWYFVLSSGVHATTAGIIAAFAIPARPKVKTHWFSKRMRKLLMHYEKIDDTDSTILEQQRQHDLVEEVQSSANITMTPLQQWSSGLERPVAFFIIPLFALLNAGVTLPQNINELEISSIWLGVFLGLLIGKPLGIMLFAFTAIKLKIAKMPKDFSMPQLLGLSCLAGIGFTMSLFISTLAFDSSNELLIQAKLGVLTGSLVAAIAGVAILSLYSKRTGKTWNKRATAKPSQN
ncbi:MAG: Na+/H+ antiporter NhaA [Gammaproteobacteria bacterium]|nr:Na+/H+ antiporter NhaA [Gammaproteobacteria bacterium]